MKFGLSERTTKIILGVATVGLIFSVFLHVDTLFLSSAYYDIYGETLFGVAFVSLLFPLLYETRYSAKQGYDFRKYLTEEYYPEWTKPMWIALMVYFVVLFGTVLITYLSGNSVENISNNFLSLGNVVVFSGSCFYHQTVLNVGRS